MDIRTKRIYESSGIYRCLKQDSVNSFPLDLVVAPFYLHVIVFVFIITRNIHVTMNYCLKVVFINFVSASKF